MFQGNQIIRIAMLSLMVGLFGAAGCASETADDQAAEMPSTETDAPAGMGDAQAPHGQVSVVMYQCADEKAFALTMASGVGQAALRIDDGVYQLDQQEVASGMEFSDGTYTFRGQGPEAYVEKDGVRIFTDCTAAGHPEAVGEPTGTEEPAN
jgi:membrane-bound inhibitor of C-type lysozyme